MQAHHEIENVSGSMAQTEPALPASKINYRRLFEAAKGDLMIRDVDTGRISDVSPFHFNRERVSK